eukprot:4678958-Prymnesium_polylepis.1
MTNAVSSGECVAVSSERFGVPREGTAFETADFLKPPSHQFKPSAGIEPRTSWLEGWKRPSALLWLTDYA